MSIELGRPLVASMGQLDPLDGLVTYCELQMTAAGDAEASSDVLVREIEDMANICGGMRWETDDPLGIGGLLTDAYRVAQFMTKQKTDVLRFFNSSTSVPALLHVAAAGMSSFIRQSSLRLPADFRLAFRELGLSIGLQAFERLRSSVDRDAVDVSAQDGLREALASVALYTGVVDAINRFWLRPDSQKVESWTDHTDINMVMLATSLAPDGYLTISGQS